MFLNRCVSLAAASVKVAAATAAKSGLRRPIKAVMTVTPAAAQQLKSLLSNKPDAYGVKIGVKKRGCSGLSYTLDYADKKSPMDEEVKAEDVKVLIDSKALFSLIGTEMDFVSDRIRSEFVFNNPNVKSTCGCGESFNVADSATQSSVPVEAENLATSPCSTASESSPNASV